MASLPRARAALFGLALGDALGMPTQGFSRAGIARRFGVVDRFHPAPAENLISHGQPAGRVTDDTDQALIVAELLVASGGRIDPAEFASRLYAWEQRMRAAGSADLLGPSTSRAIELVREGVPPDRTGREGTTNGAAMRIAPVAIATPAEPLDAFVAAVHDACRVTHDTGVAISGAAAVAAAVSAGLEGRPLEASVSLATDAARLGSSLGYEPRGEVAERIGAAIAAVRDAADPLEAVEAAVGTGVSTEESVPAAFALAVRFGDSLWETVRHAASVGGDCDTIAAMAGAIVGAHAGDTSVPDDARAALLAANPELALDRLADDLLALRARA